MRRDWLLLVGYGVVFVGVMAAVVWWRLPAAPAAEPATPGGAERPQERMVTPERWPQWRGDRGLTGVVPQVDGRQASLPSQLQLAWTVPLGAGTEASPVVAAGMVFVGTEDGTMHALRVADGELAWRRTVAEDDGIAAPALYVDGMVVVGTVRGTVVGLEGGDGTVAWRFATGDQVKGAAAWIEAADGGTDGGMDGGEKLVAVGSDDTVLYGIRLRTGEPVWRYRTDGYVQGTPAVADGRLVVGGCDGQLHVLGAGGETVSRVAVSPYVAGVAVRDGIACVVHHGGQVMAVEVASGAVLWKRRPDGATQFMGAPAVGPERVILGGLDGRIRCLRRSDGEPVWSMATHGEVKAAPVICGDTVLCGSGDGRVYLLRAADGRVLWRYDVGGAVSGSVAVAAGLVTVVTEEGRLFAFGPTTAEKGGRQ